VPKVSEVKTVMGIFRASLRRRSSTLGISAPSNASVPLKSQTSSHNTSRPGMRRRIRRLARTGRCHYIHTRRSDSGSITRILADLGEPTQAPRIAPAARGPPWEEDFDTREGDAFALSEPLPEYEFDQRVSG
jgi:hypothetical protein